MKTTKKTMKKPIKKTKRIPRGPSPMDQAEMANAAMEIATDFVERRIYLMGEINTGSAYRFLVALHIMDETKGPITIILSSGGGSDSDGYAIYDAIRMAANEVTVVGMGATMSMAAIIMQAAAHRLITPECRFMVHNGSIGVSGDLSSELCIAMGKEVENSVNSYHRVLAARSKLPLEQVREICRKETYLTARETVRNNFADAVLLPNGEIMTAKDLEATP